VRIDGRPVAVAPGTTVAAALWNAGVFRCRISLSGEPRGPLCAIGICFECRVTIDGAAHRRSCLIPCAAGMVIETARAAAAADAEATPTRREESAGPASGQSADPPVLRADVVVIGAGPAGLAAACRAAEAGASVLVIDAAAAPGGQVWRRSVGGAGGGHGAAPARLARRWLERFSASGARLLAGATVIDAVATATAAAAPELPSALPAAGATAPGKASPGAPPTAALLVEQAGRALRIEARRLVIATGAAERFLPFAGWTLPNVVGVGGAQALLKSGAGLAGRRVVIAGSGPLLLPVAAALAKAGARIALVAEQAPARAVARFAAGLWRRPRLLAQAIRYRAAFWRAPYRCGVWVTAAWGEGSVPAVHEATLTDGLRSWRERCDVLACAYGLVPNLRLARLLGCALCGGGSARAVRVDGVQQTSVAGVYCAGEPTGVGGVEQALLSGQIAGLAAAAAGPGERAPRAAAATRPRAAACGRHRPRIPAAARAAAGARRRDHRLPLRGRAGGSPRRCLEPAAGQALHADRHGPLPGTGLRSGLGAALRLGRARSRQGTARAGAARRSRGASSLPTLTRDTRRPCHALARRLSGDHHPLQARPVDRLRLPAPPCRLADRPGVPGYRAARLARRGRHPEPG
jgi:NADPH-dependent 2,4-dienoyl-CoA reductase/sulfur reductase-like enzyme